MMIIEKRWLWFGPLFFFSACVPAVFTPTVSVMPAPGKSFEVFAAEQTSCKQFAEQQIGAARDQINNQIAGGVLLGMAAGASQAAVLGGDGGAVIASAASSGAAAAGSNLPNAQMATAALQQRYDGAFSQCMFAKGNQVPGYFAAPVVPDPPRRRARHRVPSAPRASEEKAAAAQKFVEPPPSAQATPAPVVEPPPAKQ